MAKSDETKPEAPATPPSTGGGPPQNEEQRIAEQRLSALQQQASDAAGDAEKARARVAALEGELALKETELNGLRKDNEKLTAQVAGLGLAVNRSGLPVLPVKLPKDATQLNESVTIVAGVNKKRTAAKAGDVVYVNPNEKQLESLRRSVGLAATVHSVSEETAEDLAKSGFIIEPD